MSTLDSENHTNTFRMPVLPPGTLDTGAGGERIDLVTSKSTTPSTTDLYRTASQISQSQFASRPNSSCLSVLNLSLRVIFYLLVLVITIGLTLAACKFTSIWDPCEHLYVNSTECKVTSYMKGMIYYTECTEERSCILPGFESNVKRQGWSLHKPNDTATSSVYNSDNPVPVLDQ